MENANKGKVAKQRMADLERYADAAKDILRDLLNGLSKEDMVNEIKNLDLSDKGLNFLCEGIALETEDYEICSAVQQVKKERGLD